MSYSSFCNNIILPLSDLATGRNIVSYNRFLAKAQWWPREKLLNHQISSLRDVLSFANKNTHYYTQLFEKLNFDPVKLNSLKDLKRIPILTKKIIYSQGPKNMVSVPVDNLIKESTSGSTGKQANFYFSKAAQSFTYAAQLQYFNWAGYNLGDRLLQTGISLPRGIEKTIKDILYRCHYVSAFNLSDNELKSIIKLMKNKKVEYVLGYASSLYCIAKYMQERNETLPMKGVISLGDMLFPQYRNTLESVFNSKVTDTYGCCEGFMVAGQCEYSQYHVSMPLNIVEIVDKDGNSLPNGELGRIILTRLDNNPMPLIRYDIGDLGVLSPMGKCDCHRGYQVLEKILGRNTDIVVTPKGHKLVVHFFTGIFGHEETIDEFQVHQKEKSSIHILLVTRPDFNDSVSDKIRAEILNKCDGDIQVHFEFVKDIPPTSSGKRRFVISDFSLS